MTSIRGQRAALEKDFKPLWKKGKIHTAFFYNDLLRPTIFQHEALWRAHLTNTAGYLVCIFISQESNLTPAILHRYYYRANDWIIVATELQWLFTGRLINCYVDNWWVAEVIFHAEIAEKSIFSLSNISCFFFFGIMLNWISSGFELTEQDISRYHLRRWGRGRISFTVFRHFINQTYNRSV